MSRYSCADAGRARSEAVTGTASRVDRWVLVEAPGAWGPRALPQSKGLDDEVLRALQHRAKTAHARTLLIRRPGHPPLHGGRRVFAADSRPGHEALWVRSVDDAGLAELEPPFGASEGWERAEAFVGICTHGRHDPCCAVHGRLAVASIAESHRDLVWEVSHIGGDRFAANALVLPWGHYLGRLPPTGAGEVIDRVLAGERPDPYYRGRSCWVPVAQAAVGFVAAESGETRLDALRPSAVESSGAGRWRVGVDAPGGPVTVEVEQHHGPDRALLSCRAGEALAVPSWHLVGIG